MISELRPYAQQLEETYGVLERALESMSPVQLDATLGGSTRSSRAIVEHVMAGQARYNRVIIQGCDDGQMLAEPQVGATPAELSQALHSLLKTSLDLLERVPASAVGVTLAPRWGEWVRESAPYSLDVCWFAGQMVRHAAYHLGQINLYVMSAEEPGV